MAANDTLLSVLSEHARTVGDRPALIYVPDLAPGRLDASPRGEVTLSYRELDRIARRLAVGLLAHTTPGSRALLIYPPGIEFATAFAGCLYAGVIAVPVPPLDGTAATQARAAGIARDAAASLVLTDRATLPEITAWRDGSGLTDLTCLATDEPAMDGPAGSADGWTPPQLDPAAPFLLQYTSGSTSDPKGVQIGHDNVLAQAAMSRRVMSLDAQTRFGGWLPMHHDMGLIVQLIQPLILGATSVFMPAAEFLKRPQRWLQLIDAHRVGVSLAPNFAYELCRRQVTDDQVAGLDLSCWAVAGIGAETVQAQTLMAFAQRFARLGFRPEALTVGYGLAEATVYVSVGPREARPLIRHVDADRLEHGELAPPSSHVGAATLVSCGRACEVEIRIVDPISGQPLPDGAVGEIWLRGPSLAHGYWRAPQATAAAFEARTATGETGYLRTGDLGALCDGELYVTGRIKDLLIVRGRNLHPQDIEFEMRSWHRALADGKGAVFSVAAPAERVIIVHECDASADARSLAALAALAALIRGSLVKQFGIAAGGVVLVDPGSVARTASGKVQRSAMRELFVADNLRTLHEDLDADVRRCYRISTPSVAVAAPAVG